MQDELICNLYARNYFKDSDEYDEYNEHAKQQPKCHLITISR